MKHRKELIRQFAGKTQFTLDHSSPEKLEASKQDRHFHQRMLRAYLKGKSHFHFGGTWQHDQFIPTLHDVQVKWV